MTRADLEREMLVVLHRGRRGNPDVWLADSERGLVVVKDYAARPRWLRATLGRLALRREQRAYAALADHPNVPRCYGRLDADALLLEHRGGPRLSARRPWTFSAEYFRALERSVAGLHARGVLHLDLGHRSNLRADLRGEPVLIDFASALTLPTRSAAARLLLRALGWLDRRAVRKWARRLRRAAARDQGVEAAAGGSSGGGSGARRAM